MYHEHGVLMFEGNVQEDG